MAIIDDFEAGIGNWADWGTPTRTHETTAPLAGAGSQKIVSDAAAEGANYTVNNISVASGQMWRVRALATGTGGDLRMRPQLVRANFTIISTATSVANYALSSTPTTYEWDVTVSEPDAAYFRPVFINGSAATWVIDNVDVAQVVAVSRIFPVLKIGSPHIGPLRVGQKG